MVDLCQQAGIVLAVNQNMRYDQSVRACKDLLRRGLLGTPVLATIENDDKDGDGVGDVDQALSSSRDLWLAIDDVGVTGNYHVVAVLYMDGGGPARIGSSASATSCLPWPKLSLPLLAM